MALNKTVSKIDKLVIFIFITERIITQLMKIKKSNTKGQKLYTNIKRKQQHNTKYFNLETS